MLNLKPKSFLHSGAVRALTLVVILQAVLFYSASRGEIVPNNAPLLGLPSTIANWTVAKELEVDSDTRDVLKADDLLSRWYTSPNGAANLFIAFFKTQRTGQSPHSPKNCLPGSGFQPSQSGKVDVVTGGETITINHYMVSRGDESSLVLYWYQSQGRVIADEFAAKFYLVANSIKKHRSDTALVRVVVPIPPGQAAKADEIGIKFVKDLYPVVRDYLPR